MIKKISLGIQTGHRVWKPHLLIDWLTAQTKLAIKSGKTQPNWRWNFESSELLKENWIRNSENPQYQNYAQAKPDTESGKPNSLDLHSSKAG